MYKQIAVSLIMVASAPVSASGPPSSASGENEVAEMRGVEGVATEQLSGTTLSLAPRVGFETATLRVAGPDGYELTRKFDSSGLISVDLVADRSASAEPASKPMTSREKAEGLRSGRYSYELSLMQRGADRRVHSGSFAVENGVLTAPGDLRTQPPSLPRSPSDAPTGGTSPSALADADDVLFVKDTNLDGITQVVWESSDANSWLVTNNGDVGTFDLGTIAGSSYRVIMSVEPDGDIGIGTTAPQSDLHVSGGGGNLRLVDQDQPNIGNGWDINDEGPLRFIADGFGTNVVFFADSGVFIGPGNGNSKLTAEAMLHVEGSGIIEGDISLGSSRTIKHEIVPLDEASVLSAVRQLPIYSWKYKDDQAQATHTGPMAEDMYRAFRIGRDNKHLSPSDSAGLALAAIKGVDKRLEQEVEALRASNAALASESRWLLQRVTALEQMIAQKTAVKEGQ